MKGKSFSHVGKAINGAGHYSHWQRLGQINIGAVVSL